MTGKSPLSATEEQRAALEGYKDGTQAMDGTGPYEHRRGEADAAPWCNACGIGVLRVFT
jgi:hypothetical protein